MYQKQTAQRNRVFAYDNMTGISLLLMIQILTKNPTSKSLYCVVALVGGGANPMPGEIHKCLNKISSPLLDRIDIHCEIQAVSFAQLSQLQPGEPSAVIRERVIKARKIQEERFKDQKGIHCNAMMTEKMVHQYAEPDAASLDMLRMAMERLKLSARAYSRILKVARTIADLAGSENVQSMHIAEAIGYRNLDRGDWAERGM